MKKAALYARVSSLKQGEEDKASIPEQIKDIEKFCEDKGYAIIDRYIDVGYSATTKRRPEFQRMLGDCKQFKVDVIVCWHSDRLARGVHPTADLYEIMDDFSVDLEGVTEHIDDKTFAIQSAIAKIELDSIKRRTAMGRDARAKKGQLPGGHKFPYGYQKSDDKLVINQAEAEWIKHLFQWVDDGKSATSWCKWANANGYISRYGSAGITIQQVSKWLRNPVYKGEYHWGKKRKGQRNVTQDDHIIIGVAPIVAEDQWERVQKKLARNRSWSKGNSKHFYMLQNLMYCEECGKLFICGFKGAKHQRHYQCRGTRIYPHAYQCRKPYTINADILEEWVWNEVTYKVEELIRYDDVLLRIIDECRQQLENIDTQLEKEHAALKKCSSQRQLIANRERQGYLKPDEAELQYRAIKSEEERHEEEIKKLESMKDKKNPLLVQELVQRLNWWNMEYEWGAALDIIPEKKREFLLQVVDRITISGDNRVEIRLKLEASELVTPVASLSNHTVDQNRRIVPFDSLSIHGKLWDDSSNK